MDIKQFLLELLEALSNLEFVEETDFHTEVFVLKGRALLKKNRFLQVYYNEVTGTTAFALIEGDKRIWGVAFDNMRGWHLHPLEAPDDHFNLDSITIETVIKKLAEVWVFIS